MFIKWMLRVKLNLSINLTYTKIKTEIKSTNI